MLCIQQNYTNGQLFISYLSVCTDVCTYNRPYRETLLVVIDESVFIWFGHILGLCSCPAVSQRDMMLTWQGNSLRQPPMDENEVAQQTMLHLL